VRITGAAQPGHQLQANVDSLAKEKNRFIQSTPNLQALIEQIGTLPASWSVR
jgi:hypothetical protein